MTACIEGCHQTAVPRECHHDHNHSPLDRTKPTTACRYCGRVLVREVAGAFGHGWRSA